MKKMNYLLIGMLSAFQLFTSCQQQYEVAKPDGYSSQTEAQIAEPIEAPASYGSDDSAASRAETEDTTRIYRDEIEKEIQELVNDHRRSIGKTPMEFRYEIFTEARNHSIYMAKNKVLTHQGFSQRVSRIRTSLGAAGGSAENVAYGYTSARAVVNGWLQSPGHKKNIEGDYNVTGIGVATDSKGIRYYTQIFHKVPATDLSAFVSQ